MIGTHRTVSVIAEVRYHGYCRSVVLCDSHGNSIMGAEVGTQSVKFVAQGLRSKLQHRMNQEVMYANAMNGTTEPAYKVQCLLLEGVGA